jgi:hypothetical protein
MLSQRYPFLLILVAATRECKSMRGRVTKPS